MRARWRRFETAGDKQIRPAATVKVLGCLKHSMAFDEGLAGTTACAMTCITLDSSRSVAYGDVNKLPIPDMRQQYL